jgi:hypothetical protein
MRFVQKTIKIDIRCSCGVREIQFRVANVRKPAHGCIFVLVATRRSYMLGYRHFHPVAQNLTSQASHEYFPCTLQCMSRLDFSRFREQFLRIFPGLISAVVP